MADLVSSDRARRGEWRDVPTGQLRTTYFLESPAGTDLPQCFRVENTPHRHLDTHYHETDQFQVIVDGVGTLGRHALKPFSVHFARAHTPYGPIVAGPQGLTWLSLRAQHDDGAKYMPASKAALLAIKGRSPWQTTESVAFEDLPDDGTFCPLPNISDGRGLGAHAVRAKPGMRFTLPDPSGTGGQFFVVVRGGTEQEEKAADSLATMLVRPDEGSVTMTAGAQGLDALLLSFSRPERPDMNLIETPSGGDKVWHCEPCGFMYDEAAGVPEEGIPPGTRFADLPDHWLCPDCSAGREEFVEVQG